MVQQVTRDPSTLRQNQPWKSLGTWGGAASFPPAVPGALSLWPGEKASLCGSRCEQKEAENPKAQAHRGIARAPGPVCEAVFSYNHCLSPLLTVRMPSNPHHFSSPKSIHQQDRPSGTRRHGEPFGAKAITPRYPMGLLSARCFDIRKESLYLWPTGAPAD